MIDYITRKVKSWKRKRELRNYDYYPIKEIVDDGEFHEYSVRVKMNRQGHSDGEVQVRIDGCVVQESKNIVISKDGNTFRGWYGPKIPISGAKERQDG